VPAWHGRMLSKLMPGILAQMSDDGEGGASHPAQAIKIAARRPRATKPADAGSPSPTMPGICVYRQASCWRNAVPPGTAAVHAKAAPRRVGQPQRGLVAAGRLQGRARERPTGARVREPGDRKRPPPKGRASDGWVGLA
jgi:hypothetical protein